MLAIEEKYELLANLYVEKYNEVLNLLYKVAFETNPQAFRLADKKNIKLLILNLNKKIFPRYHIKLVFCFSKEANFSLEFKDFTDSSYYLNYSDFGIDHIWLENLINNELGINEKDILYSMNTYNYIDSTPQTKEDYLDSLDIFSNTIFDNMKNLARDEGKEFQKHSNLTSGYYAKNAASYAYSLLDLDPIIKKVNDEDFEYQLDQAIAAYDNSLYMASCATLGVCLETVCKLILVNNGKKIRDSESTLLDKLSEKLKCEQLISYKDKSRIDVCYKVRNLSSHTSPGKTVQNDCHFILNTIQLLVEEYF